MPELPDPETMGPVDIAVIVFEGDAFNGDIAESLAELNEAGIVRIYDMAFVLKDAAGETSWIEMEDADYSQTAGALSGHEFDLLSDEDLEAIGSELAPGTSALAVVWENAWAARFAAAVRGSRGQVASMVRIPREDVIAAFEAGMNDELAEELLVEELVIDAVVAEPGAAQEVKQ